MAGQLAIRARRSTYFLAPFINSYKRFQSPAPSRRRKMVWSDDNRTAGFRARAARARKAMRMECRIGGADLNPYLAFAALIAAGLAGIEERAGACRSRSSATPI